MLREGLCCSCSYSLLCFAQQVTSLLCVPAFGARQLCRAAAAAARLWYVLYSLVCSCCVSMVGVSGCIVGVRACSEGLTRVGDLKAYLSCKGAC